MKTFAMILSALVNVFLPITTVFYLLLVLTSGIEFNWFWFLIAFIIDIINETRP